jgi:hypothetical protein
VSAADIVPIDAYPLRVLERGATIMFQQSIEVDACEAYKVVQTGYNTSRHRAVGTDASRHIVGRHGVSVVRPDPSSGTPDPKPARISARTFFCFGCKMIAWQAYQRMCMRTLRQQTASIWPTCRRAHAAAHAAARHQPRRPAAEPFQGQLQSDLQ